jgi:hypothetical protein
VPEQQKSGLKRNLVKRSNYTEIWVKRKKIKVFMQPHENMYVEDDRL